MNIQNNQTRKGDTNEMAEKCWAQLFASPNIFHQLK